MKPIFKKFRTLDKGCARRGGWRGRCENPQGGAKKHMNQLTRSYFYILGQIPPLRFCKSSLYICYNRFPITAQPRLWISTNHPSLPYSLHFPHVKSNMCILHSITQEAFFSCKIFHCSARQAGFQSKAGHAQSGHRWCNLFLQIYIILISISSSWSCPVLDEKNITQINFGELPWLHSKSEIFILGA